MSRFLRLLSATDKANALVDACARVREGYPDARVIDVDPESFKTVPGEPFAYWVSEAVRSTFARLPRFQGEARTVKQGLATADDFRFVRLWWEIETSSFGEKWCPFAKGGSYSPFYADIYLVVNWEHDGKEISNYFDPTTGSLKSRPQNTNYYFRPGITWPLRASRFAPQILPSGCIFSVRGYCAFPESGEESKTLAIFNSSSFDYLFKTLLGRFGYPEFIVGMLQIMPWPSVPLAERQQLDKIARSAWSLKRTLDTVNETSHAFLMPAGLRERRGDYDPSAIQAELTRIQAEIDAIAFDLYGFSEVDRELAQSIAGADDRADPDHEDGGGADEATTLDALLAWTVGVAFGRFDWRLATGERTPPPEPEPFDPMPAKSPGMLPDEAAPFHHHPGMLVDDPGHEHHLPRLIEAILERVDASVDRDIRRWLRTDFFNYHLQQYSKSNRKAPIYWPLATASGDYTVWVYYPMLTAQTLFTAVNDFVEPKLQQVADDIAALRQAGANRSRQEEQRLSTLVDFEMELAELRDALLAIAPGYKPDQDDGVQITAAPLWRLFLHRQWRNVLSDTWERLERGDYDWAKLAMAYWPERVREKCVTDQSLAIAHDLEHLYEPPATG